MEIIPPIDEPEKRDRLNTYQQASIEYSDNQYTASLPWKNDHEPLTSNVAKGRTGSTIQRLSRTPEMLQNYSELIA
ncbi:hypothetical protein DPMN_029552 [Dreissena polymorpha]|uniref:Uncharacterized protein n=1 Tax=Dreissena polymorpha TaxID=45954 RepID=A0A9D4RGC4_DREPO|nr:hypothetical protein DPMN_029552 [Dreissena polymorpha]